MNILEIGIERGTQIGIEKGTQIGIEKGERQKLTTQVEKKLKKGCTVEEMADMLEESVESIRSIIETIQKK